MFTNHELVGLSTDSSFKAFAYYQKHQIIKNNSDFARIFGYSNEELVGTYVHNLFTLESYNIAIKNCIKGKETINELDCKHKNNSIFKCMISHKLVNADGQTIGVLTAKEISRKSTSNNKQFDKYTALFEHSLD